MTADLSPLVLAVAGLILACTPVAVAYLTVQVELIKKNLSAQDAALADHRANTAATLERIERASGTAAAAATTVAQAVEKRAP
jgi:hypothetical protein